MADKEPPTTLRFPDDEACRCLRAGELEQFRRLTAGRPTVDFSNSDLRGVDLRHVDFARVVIRGCYLRDADLRGLDLRPVDLEGASIFHARVSGTYFPPTLSADEIRLSVECGTRLRMGK